MGTQEHLLIAHCHYLQSTHGDLGGYCSCICFHQSVARQVANLAYMFHIVIIGSEVCGRYADDTRLIHTSVNAHTSVVGPHCKLPSLVIILINGQLFSLGSRVLQLILNPAVLAPHKLSLPS